MNGHHHPGGPGAGPLRVYGGGLGVIGNGEIKLLLLVTLLAGVVRLWRLDRPDSVVFDEVHFGGESPLSPLASLLLHRPQLYLNALSAQTN